MSEEAKPEIGEWQASDDGSHIYSDDFTFDAMLVLSGNFGSVAKRKRYADQIARSLNEITALRAALDEERAKVERLRAFAQSLNHRDWARQSMFNHGLVDSAGDPTALLSGRGEAGSDGRG